MYLLVVKQLCTMFIIGIGGFIFAKSFKVSDEQQKFLSKMLLYFINPCLVINSFNKEFQPDKLLQLGFVILVSTVVFLVTMGVAIIFTLPKKGDDESAVRENAYNTVDRLAIIFTNCGFMGIPLIRGVFGDEGVFFLMGYLIVFNVFLWTYGLFTISGTMNFKKIITNPNIIAILLGIVIFCMPFTLPEVIARPVMMIGELNTATAMILIGVLFADFTFEKEYALKLLRVTFVRLIAASFVTLAVIWGVYLITKNHFDSRMMLFVVYICSMCPSATSVPSLSCVYDKDARYASLVVSVTSLVCMGTIPLFVALAEFLLK